jgi:hypothetical protein
MKESLMDKIDRHVVYFLTGIVAMLSTMLVTTFVYMLLLPIVVFGHYYLIVLPIFLASIYYVGRRIMNEKDN